MRNPRSYLAGRHLALSVVLTLLSALFVSLSGVAPAAAAGEVVNFSVSSSSTPEGSAPVINVVLTNTALLNAPVVVTVIATPSGADPAEVGDYTLSLATVTFPPNSPNGTSLPVSLSFTSDTIYENNETFTLTLVSPTVGSIGPNNTHIVTIANDDTAPTLSIADRSTGEALGPMVFTVTRTGLTEVTANAVATPTSGTAAIVDDFAAIVEPISIAPGGATGTDTYSIALVSDVVYEPDETLNVTLSGLVAAIIPGSDLIAIGTIEDDDIPPTLSIDNVVVNEAAATADFTITRTGATAFDTDFDIATSDIEAIGGTDYTSQTDTLTILSGGPSGTTTLAVPIANDDIDELTETFLVTLTNPVEATILKATGTATITDDDTAAVGVDDGDGIFVLEGGAADTLDIVLESEPTAPVTVTLTAALDQLTLTPSQVVFDSTNWDTAREISVGGFEDGVDEEDPHTSPISFAVTSADTNYAGANPADVIATIGDADALLVSINGPSVGLPGEAATFTAMVNAGGTGTITYEWAAFFLGNEVANGDQSTFQFTPAAGGPYNIQVTIGDEQNQNPARFIQFRALSDVGGSVFIDDILWLAENEITKGCNPPDNDLFCPTDVVTRGQMAAFLVRFLGLTDDGGGNTFTDDDGSIFENDIAKLATAGITKGCNPPTNDNFCPDDPVTREQMAAFLVRALGLTDDGGGNTFTDDDGSIFENDIAKLATAGITRGCNPPANTEFCPTDFVTREQMAAFIRRADGVLNP
ncbi:MAG: Calx-beta domain-containing protein [Actinomycetota bacterium]|nr:Calx-beta domain-containing protein [Actinomycetota bacterium]